MKITERFINESHVYEVMGLIQSGSDNVMNIDREDVERVLVGKEGALYQTSQEEGMDNQTFMKEFFNELKQRGEAQTCTSMLICIGMLQDNPLTIDDMGVINDFLDEIYKDNLEVKWGVTNTQGERMSLMVVCAKEE